MVLNLSALPPVNPILLGIALQHLTAQAYHSAIGWQAGHPLNQSNCCGGIVIHNVPLPLFGLGWMLTQPAHGGATAIQVSIHCIDLHTAAFGWIIEPFATETNTLECSHIAIIQLNCIMCQSMTPFGI